MNAIIELETEEWPFSAAPEPADSKFAGKTFWAHVAHAGETWNLIIQLDKTWNKQKALPAQISFRHPEAPHDLITVGNVLDLCVGVHVYARATVVREE